MALEPGQSPCVVCRTRLATHFCEGCYVGLCFECCCRGRYQRRKPDVSYALSISCPRCGGKTFTDYSTAPRPSWIRRLQAWIRAVTYRRSSGTARRGGG